MKASDTLFPLVQSFFCDHLKKVRGASPHTVAAYRDAMRLFLQFLADRRGLPVARLQLTDLEVEAVAAFLQHLEEQRHNSIATRNCRRIALRAFFQHALRQDPSRASQFDRVLALPPKRCTQPLPRSLEPSQMRRLLAQPNRRTLSGQRDYALLLFLYNTGVRISEAVAVCRRDLQFVVPYHVRVQGKGGNMALRPYIANEGAFWNAEIRCFHDPPARQARPASLRLPSLRTALHRFRCSGGDTRTFRQTLSPFTPWQRWGKEMLRPCYFCRYSA